MSVPRRAFSLVELIATMTVVVLLATVTTAVMSQAVGAHGTTGRSAELTTRASLALTRITDELSKIQTVASGDQLDLSALTPTRIAWTGRADIHLAGAAVILTAPGGSQAILCDGCTSLTITGYDDKGDPIPPSPSALQLAAVSRIGIDIVLSDQGGAAHLRTRVFPWSLLRSPR